MRVIHFFLAVLLLQIAAFAGASPDLTANASHADVRATLAPAPPAAASADQGAQPASTSETVLSNRTYLLPATMSREEFRRDRKAAGQGSAWAQFRVGESLDKCDPRQFRKAAQWYAKAAQQGYAPAQNALALMYWFGRGVRRDDAAAFAWFQRAADSGLTAAQHNLGLMYFDGKAVAQDQVLGDAWLRVAAAGGNHVSASVLQQMEAKMDETTLARARHVADQLAVRFQVQLALAQ